MQRAWVRDGKGVIDGIQPGAKVVAGPIHLLWQGSGILQKQTGIGSNHGSGSLGSISEC